MASWHGSVGFAARMSNTMRIMSSCKSAFPALDKAELRAKAAEIEGELFDRAASKEHYQRACDERTRELGASVPHSEEQWPEDESVPIQKIGPYEARYHASGVTSTVYRSVASSARASIAIKLTTPHQMLPPHDSRREARLLRLARHAAVVPLLSTESVAGGHFLLTFPFLPCDFGTMLRRSKLDRIQISSHLRSLFAALEHVHSLGIIHRDVKPSNLLLSSPSGPAYLIDFGIAWHADDSRDSEPPSQKITDVGTTCYRPPELLFGHAAYGPAVDLWAAGCVVAEALRGGGGGAAPLFDAGDLGSDLTLLRSIFQALGTPSDESWPEARTFPDWGKMQFVAYPPKPWPELLPDVDPHGRGLVESLVAYQSSSRLSAAEVLKHPYFKSVGPEPKA